MESDSDEDPGNLKKLDDTGAFYDKKDLERKNKGLNLP
jgi:hypothetical protein